MGQTTSEVSISMGTFNDHPFSSEDDTKVERHLRHLSETSDETKIIFKWEKMVDKRAKTPLDRWGLASFAIQTLERWGKNKLMLIFSVYQIEVAHEVLNDKSANGKTAPDPITGVAIMGDSQLNLAR